MTTTETYMPLYRKYRPQQFSDLVGQEVVSTAIQNALNLHKIAHAYLFCGPRGTGKTSSARIFAKSLNCINGPTPTPCHACPSCVSITQGNALDVTEIDAASNNGVDNIRDLTDKVQFSPIEGKFKVYIIDEVHMLSTAAFNALLKTLEEPPPNVIFVFATTEPHKVLPTIISRCQRFDFSRITTDQIEARLSQVAQMEGITIAPEAVSLIARHVRGGLRDALGLLDQVSVLGRSEAGRAIQVEDVRLFIGALEEDLLLEITQGIVEKDPQRILQQIQQLQARGVEPPQMVKELTHHFRNLLIAKTCGQNAQGEMFDISPEHHQKLWQQSQGFENEEIPQILNRLSLLEAQLRNSHQPQLWLEVALLDLCYRQDILLVKQLAARVEALEASFSNGIPAVGSSNTAAPAVRQPIPSADQKPIKQNTFAQRQPEPAHSEMALEPPKPSPLPEVSSSQSNSSQDLGRLWHQIIDAIQHMPTKALVKDYFSLTHMDEQSITISYSKETIFETFKRTPEKSKYLDQAINTALGRPYRVHFKPITQVKEEIRPNTPVVPPSQSNSTSNKPVSSVLPTPTTEIPAANQVLPNQSPDDLKPSPTLQTNLTPVQNMPEPITETDIEMQQVKQYTQELLQAKILD